jgi:hypothetical protein
MNTSQRLASHEAFQRFDTQRELSGRHAALGRQAALPEGDEVCWRWVFRLSLLSNVSSRPGGMDSTDTIRKAALILDFGIESLSNMQVLV